MVINHVSKSWDDLPSNPSKLWVSHLSHPSRPSQLEGSRPRRVVVGVVTTSRLNVSNVSNVNKILIWHFMKSWLVQVPGSLFHGLLKNPYIFNQLGSLSSPILAAWINEGEKNRHHCFQFQNMPGITSQPVVSGLWSCPFLPNSPPGWPGASWIVISSHPKFVFFFFSDRKKHGISKLMVWKYQNRVKPLHRRVQWFLGEGLFESTLRILGTS